MTLTEFLLERIEEDEAPVRAAVGRRQPLTSLHKRQQRECAAKRAVASSALERTRIMNRPPEYSHDLRVLASIYVDHPDYRREWRP